MQKLFTSIFMQTVAAGVILLGHSAAQGTPPSGSTPPAQSGSAQSTGSSPAKTGTAKKAPVTARSGTAYTLKTQKDKSSYALGLKIGGDLKRQGVTAAVDPAVVARGLKDALARLRKFGVFCCG